jgi:hypothetical protein
MAYQPKTRGGKFMSEAKGTGDAERAVRARRHGQASSPFT